MSLSRNTIRKFDISISEKLASQLVEFTLHLWLFDVEFRKCL